MKKTIAAFAGAALALGAAPAFAGEWRLDQRRCADIREDFRDARESRRDEWRDYGRYDRREDRYDRRESRRDRSITICPRSAFYYVDDRGRDWRDDNRGRDDWRDNDRRDNGRGDVRSRARQPRLDLKYDRSLRMHYRYDGGRRIYVRG
jgi:hypothetical protein